MRAPRTLWGVFAAALLINDSDIEGGIFFSFLFLIRMESPLAGISIQANPAQNSKSYNKQGNIARERSPTPLIVQTRGAVNRRLGLG